MPEKSDSGELREATPTDEFSREDYAIHARRGELPLFGKAVAGERDDTGWISSLSGSIGAATKAASDPATAQAEKAISRRADRGETA